MEWRACLTNIDEFLSKWSVFQKLNIAQYSTKEIVQGLVDHLLLYKHQEEWYSTRAKDQVLGAENSKRVNLINTRNSSMMENRDYTILNEEDSDSESEQNNSFARVKETLASAGANDFYRMLLLFVEYVIKIRPRISMNVQSTSTEELKQLAQSQSILKNVKISANSVSYMWSAAGDHIPKFQTHHQDNRG